ncbi:hypothetical protein ES703_71644 [subsurface metagenome]
MDEKDSTENKIFAKDVKKMKNALIHHKESLTLFACLSLIFLLYVSTIPQDITSSPMFYNPSENMYYFFSQLYKESGSLSYTPPYVNKVPGDIYLAFTPRDAAMYNSNIVLQGTLYTPIIYGTLLIFLEDLYFLLTPIISIFSLVVLYLIFKNIFNSVVALVSIILLSLLPIYWFLSVSIVSDTILSSFMFLLGVYWVTKLLNHQKLSFYILASIFFAFSLGTRYENILLLLPLILIFIIVKLKEINWKYLLASIIVTSIILFNILYLNNLLYGSPFKTGYHILLEDMFTSFGRPPPSTLEPPIEVVGQILKNHVFGTYKLVAIFGIFGLMYLIKKIRFEGNKVLFYIVYILITLCTGFWFFGTEPSFGFNIEVIHPSFIKHNLIEILLFVPFLSIFVIEMKRFSKMLVLLLILILVINNVSLALFLDEGIIKQKNKNNYRLQIYNKVMEVTELDSIIITVKNDKILFPSRNILVSYYLFKHNNEWEPFPRDPTILAEKIIKIKDSINKSLYIEELPTGKYITILENKLKNHGYRLELILNFKGYRLYKIQA